MTASLGRAPAPLTAGLTGHSIPNGEVVTMTAFTKIGGVASALLLSFAIGLSAVGCGGPSSSDADSNSDMADGNDNGGSDGGGGGGGGRNQPNTAGNAGAQGSQGGQAAGGSAANVGGANSGGMAGSMGGSPAAAGGAGGATSGVVRNGCGTFPSDNLISNFEGGKAEVVPAAGRQGAWFIAVSSMDTGALVTPVKQDAVALPVVMPGACGTDYAFRLTGKNVAQPQGVVLGTWLAKLNAVNAPYDATAYKGIAFQAKAAAPTPLVVRLSDDETEPDAGICQNASGPNQCADFRSTVQLTTAWQDFLIPFSALTQPSFGKRSKYGKLNAAQIYKLRLQIQGNAATPITFDVHFDDVRFLTSLDGNEIPPPPKEALNAGCKVPGFEKHAFNVVEVSSTAALNGALKNAAAGTLIRLAAGTYKGAFSTGADGTEGAPIVLCSEANAVLEGTSMDSDVLKLESTRHWVLSSFTIKGGKRGLYVTGSSNVQVLGVTVHGSGQEAIHFLENSSNNLIKGCKVRDTGKAEDIRGEGIYIGQSINNWSSRNNPDRSDNNRIIENDIGPNVTAEHIDIKEGTSGGLIEGNRFFGAGQVVKAEVDSWVDVKGSGWQIKNNAGTTPQHDGFSVNQIDGAPKSGENNVFSGNTGFGDKTNKGRFAYNFDNSSLRSKNTVQCTPGADSIVNFFNQAFSVSGGCQ